MISKIKFSVFACLVASAALMGGCSGEVISSGDFDQNGENNGADQPGDGGDQPGDGGDEPAKCISPDQDGDTISDELEGCTEADDKDGDTIPNCSDDDSDGDTIPDSVEADTKGCSGNFPGNTDNDAYPNYLDDDSDGNRILDKDEGDPSVDTDNDTVPDFLDDDDDGDGVSDILEIMGMPNSGDINLPVGQFSGDCNGDGVYDAQGNSSSPIDCDSDLIPDYKDKDSDGDGMLDAVEYYHILGEFYARYSQDTDGNGVSDTDEAGADPNHPIDTDGDGVPDFLDNDNDNDGLPDKYEVSIGSNPNVEDSDGDNASDLVEIGAGTDPNDSSVNPMTEGNFVFVVPYNGEASPKKQTLSFETGIQTVDLFFAFDQSGTMGDEVSSLKNGLKNIIDNLKCKDFGKTCVDHNDCLEFTDSICSELGKCIQNPSSGEGCFDNMWTGLGYYEKPDSFWVASHLSSDTSKTVDALARFRSSGNNEAAYQAPICALLGTTDANMCQSSGSNNCAGGSSYSRCAINCTKDTSKVGCVGYRNEAIRIFVHAFDENQCNNSGQTARCTDFKNKVGTIMQNYKTRYVGLYSTQNTSTNDGDISNMDVASDIGKKSKSVDTSNNPFIYKAMDADLANQAAQGVKKIAGNMPVQVTSLVEDIDANAKNLIKSLNVNIVDAGKEVQGKICETISGSSIVSGQFEGINNLMPGKVVCYDVIPVDNQTLFKPTEEPLVLKARIKVLGDGSVLNSGIAYFVVPPVYEDNSIN